MTAEWQPWLHKGPLRTRVAVAWQHTLHVLAYQKNTCLQASYSDRSSLSSEMASFRGLGWKSWPGHISGVSALAGMKDYPARAILRHATRIRPHRLQDLKVRLLASIWRCGVVAHSSPYVAQLGTGNLLKAGRGNGRTNQQVRAEGASVKNLSYNIP